MVFVCFNDGLKVNVYLFRRARMSMNPREAIPLQSFMSHRGCHRMASYNPFPSFLIAMPIRKKSFLMSVFSDFMLTFANLK